MVDTVQILDRGQALCMHHAPAKQGDAGERPRVPGEREERDHRLDLELRGGFQGDGLGVVVAWADVNQDVPKAYAKLESGRAVGKVVVEVSS
jgi:hypothetical protein